MSSLFVCVRVAYFMATSTCHYWPACQVCVVSNGTGENWKLRTSVVPFRKAKHLEVWINVHRVLDLLYLTIVLKK
eukprot:2349472-Amphidinium_carterae.1